MFVKCGMGIRKGCMILVTLGGCTSGTGKGS